MVAINADTTQTEKFIRGLFAVGRELKSSTADGIGIEDLIDQLAPGGLRDAFVALNESAPHLDAELTDLDVREGIGLGRVVLEEAQTLWGQGQGR